MSWGPSSKLPRRVEEVSSQNLDAFDDIECTQVELHTQVEPPTQGVSEESTHRCKGKGEKREKGEKRKHKEILDEKLIEVGDHISKVAKMLLEKYNLPDEVDACMDKLATMGWSEFDPKYQTAILLFGESADVKRVWLRLAPSSCEMWVRNAGAKYGLL